MNKKLHRKNNRFEVRPLEVKDIEVWKEAHAAVTKIYKVKIK